MKVKYRNSSQILKDKYLESKKEMDSIISDFVLIQWFCLTKANKLGKQVWKDKFTTTKLARDLGIPTYTAKLCLALDNAKESHWEFIRAGKISAKDLATLYLKNDKAELRKLDRKYGNL